jgi:hypothetical protein
VQRAVTITHKLDLGALHALLTSQQGGVARDMLRRGLHVETAAKKNLQTEPRRVDTGRLRASINTQMITVDGAPAVVVGTDVNYAIYVHEGTGLYGPHAKMIVPVNKKVLRWKTRGAGMAARRKAGTGGWTFSQKSSGMKANPFLKNALPAARG